MGIRHNRIEVKEGLTGTHGGHLLSVNRRSLAEITLQFKHLVEVFSKELDAYKAPELIAE